MLGLDAAQLAAHPRRPLVMGILNVTPDSFSDGGAYASVDAAVEHASAMLDAGADLIDVGPESTRPGAASVSAAEQIARAAAVIERICKTHPDAIVSIDTRLASVAEAALDAGARIVNDVSALRADPGLADVVAGCNAGLVLMHMRGTPETMQDDPYYADVVADVRADLLDRARTAEGAGIAREKIALDPGIGFGKTTMHNIALLQNLERFIATGYPVLLGASRKRFLSEFGGGIEEPRERLGGSLACVVRASTAGAAIVRVHDVRATCQLLDTLDAVSGESKESQLE